MSVLIGYLEGIASKESQPSDNGKAGNGKW